MAVDGTYNVEIEAPIGKVTGILKIKAEGETLSGSYGAHDKVQPLTGTITGNHVTFVTAVGDPPQQIKLEFEGEVADNLITGGARADGSEPSPFKGIRSEV